MSHIQYGLDLDLLANREPTFLLTQIWQVGIDLEGVKTIWEPSHRSVLSGPMGYRTLG